MKKFSKYFVAAAIVVAATAAVLVGCKKEEQTSGKQEKSVSGYDETQQPSESEEKIISFINDYQGMKKGEKAEGEDMSLEDARHMMETAFNYCYGFTQSHLCDMRRDVIRFHMPETGANGRIKYSDILNTFEVVVADVRCIYNAIDMEDKVLKYIMVCLDEESSKDGDAKIVITTGRNSDNEGNESNGLVSMPWYGQPFEDDECYWWDAAAGVIQQKTIDWDVAHWRYYTPCPDCYTYIDSIHLQYSFMFPEHNWCFHDTIARYICYQELNQLYGDIMLNTHYNGMEVNPYGCDWYYETIVYPMRINEGDAYPYRFGTDVYFATRLWRHYGEYPIPINEEY